MDHHAAARAADAQIGAEQARTEADDLAATGEQVEGERDAAIERTQIAEGAAQEAHQRAEAAEAEATRLAGEIEGTYRDARTARDDAATAKALRDEISYTREQIQQLENRLYERMGPA